MCLKAPLIPFLSKIKMAQLPPRLGPELIFGIFLPYFVYMLIIIFVIALIFY